MTTAVAATRIRRAFDAIHSDSHHPAASASGGSTWMKYELYSLMPFTTITRAPAPPHHSANVAVGEARRRTASAVATREPTTPATQSGSVFSRNPMALLRAIA